MEYTIIKCGHGRHEILGIDRPHKVGSSHLLQNAMRLAIIMHREEPEYQYNVFDDADYRVYSIG